MEWNLWMGTEHVNAGTKEPDIWCVVPAYNCAASAVDVAKQCRDYLSHVVVVDDGSTDADLRGSLADTDIRVLRHSQNRGKGAALLTALRYVRENGGTHVIAVDADGQHLPADLPCIVNSVEKRPASIIIGCRDFNTAHVPDGSRFGRAFSNLWVRLETGVSLDDTQSGFRGYPVQLVSRLRLRGVRYDFEIEVLTRAIWGGMDVVEVPVRVVYPPKDQRITSFRPFVDNLRLSLMHSRLIGRRLLPWPHRKLVQRVDAASAVHLLRHPLRSLRMLLRENATPSGLAASAAVGTILAVLPLVGCHSIAILYATARLHLNKVMALSVQNLYAPPFVPFLCIEVGYFLRHGTWWTEFSRETLVEGMHLRALEWLLGSLVLAPIFAAVAGGITFAAARAIGRRVAANRAGRKA